MSKYFQYDVIKLMNSIKDRPCLWDKSLECYKDRVDRRLAWEEVFKILEPHYDEKTSKEKKITEELIVAKWTNIRDAFMKTLRYKYGKPKRKYIYYKELEFLVNFAADQTVNSDENSYISTECTNDSETYSKTTIKDEKDSEKEYNPIRYKTCKRSKKSDSSEKSSDFNFIEVDESTEPRIMNEDEAFFASLLPSVVRYSEDERLEFRIEVLALMKRIRVSRNWMKPL